MSLTVTMPTRLSFSVTGIALLCSWTKIICTRSATFVSGRTDSLSFCIICSTRTPVKCSRNVASLRLLSAALFRNQPIKINQMPFTRPPVTKNAIQIPSTINAQPKIRPTIVAIFVAFFKLPVAPQRIERKTRCLSAVNIRKKNGGVGGLNICRELGTLETLKESTFYCCTTSSLPKP